MIKKLLIGICLGFGIWSLGFPSHGATWLDPNLKWKTIETPHFSIHYYDKIEKTARRMVPIVEEVHNKISPILKHVPDLKTNVVLLDITDYANGFTTVIPNPNVTLYVTDGGSNLRPIAYETWLKYVFLHEYTHILHLDTTEGAARFFKLIFGRISFPNGIMPTFAIEGMATYFETRHGYGGGRGVDPRWEAMMRMDVLENNIKSIDQAAVNTVRWPDGSLRYLYGVMFLEYLADKYGEDKLIRISQEYGDYLLSYYEGIDGLFRNLYGKSLWLLWNDWIDSIKEKYGKQKNEIEKDGLTRFKLLTNRGYYVLKPKWDADSKQIYYSQNNQDEYPCIRRINYETMKNEKMLEGFVFDDSLSIHGERLYFSKEDIYKNYYVYKDLFSLDLGNRKLKRISEGLRATDPAVSPDGTKLVYVKNDDGVRSLWMRDIDSNNDRMIGKYENDVQYMSPSFSPDGSKIAVAKWTYGGHQGIYLINVNDGKEEKLVDFGLSANPCFSPDGEYVIFDSDASGIVNLHAFNLKSKKIYRITNVLGAAMMPDVSPDGKKIAFVNYSSHGYDLALIDYDVSSFKEAKAVPKAEIKNKKTTAELTGIITPKINKTEPATFETSTHDYNPLPSFTPKFWLPYSFVDENGPHTLIYTAAIDALSQQSAELQFGFDWTAKRPSYSFTYTNNQFLPQISINTYDAPVPYSWDDDSIIYWERERGGGVYFSFVDNRVFYEYDKQAVTMGYVIDTLSNIISMESLILKPSIGDIKGASLAWRYSSLRQYGYSICPEDGMDISLRANLFSADLGSKYTFNNYSFSGSKYFGLAAHNVLGLKSWASFIRGEQIIQSGFTWSYLGLRGYPSKTFSGTKQLKETMEYNFPITIIESGMGYGLTFFDRLWGKFFLEAGGATFNKLELLTFSKSYGAEINLDTINGYGYMPLTLTLGYAKGIDAGGEEQIYFSFSL